MAHAPFDESDRAKFDEMFAKIKAARQLMIRAQTAGIDVAEHKKTLDDAEADLRKIKQVFLDTH